MILLRKTVNCAKSRWHNLFFPYKPYMRRYKCIYVHIPKTAGTSILSALGQKGRGRNHFPWYIYHSASPRKFNKYFKFAFVRNPWTRLYSAYRYLRSGGNQVEDLKISHQINEYANLEEFIINGLGEGFFRNNPIFIPQSFFVIGLSGEVVVDFIGKYENLNEDFRVAAEKIGVKPALPKTNVSKQVNNKNELFLISPESKKIIYELYKQDIKYFQYDFPSNGEQE